MADEYQISILSKSVREWNEWRRNNLHKPTLASGGSISNEWDSARFRDGPEWSLYRPNFAGADLTGADLVGADLDDADFSEATLTDAMLNESSLRGAILEKANLTGAFLDRADLSDANLRDGILRDISAVNADFTRAQLHRADLSNAILSASTLIGSVLDHARLTGATLWETRRSGWSIKSVICDHAYWEHDRSQRVEYREGEFERAHRERPTVTVMLQDGITPIEIAMMPLILNRLERDHPGCSIRLRSISEEGGSAKIVISVEDTAQRPPEKFQHDFDSIKTELQGRDALVKNLVESQTALIRLLETALKTPHSITARYAVVGSNNVQIDDGSVNIEHLQVELAELEQAIVADKSKAVAKTAKEEALDIVRSVAKDLAKDASKISLTKGLNALTYLAKQFGPILATDFANVISHIKQMI